MTYTKEQVQEALEDRGNITSREYSDRIRWASTQFLAALPVIEWYGDEKNYPSWSNECSEANLDGGQKAREYLEKLNQNKE